MGSMNSTLLDELLTEQKLRDLQAEFDQLHLAAAAPAPSGSNLRGALASTLVRWGLRLDPAAGERVRALDLAAVAAEGRKGS